MENSSLVALVSLYPSSLDQKIAWRFMFEVLANGRLVLPFWAVAQHNAKKASHHDSDIDEFFTGDLDICFLGFRRLAVA